MLNKIINLINYFRVTRNNLFRELKFFHEPAPKNISQIENYKFKSEIVNEILKFNTNCNFFYKNLSINQELKIEGLWKNHILKSKKEQIDAYSRKNIDEIMILHESMFYNCLLQGFWNYSHFKNLNFNYSAILFFLKDLNLYKTIFRNFDDLPSNNQIKKWGYKYKNDKIHFIDISSMMQKNLILNALNLLNNKRKHNILEIGSGFGSLAERLFEENRINTMIMLDIPSSLTIAFYYLSSKFGLDKVKILNSPSDIQKYYDLDESKKILLIPTCYYDLIKNIKNIDLLCNFASFSEMDFNTIKFYLENLSKEIKIIVSSNSNLPVNKLNHQEVISDRFPIPKYFDLVFSTVQIPFFSNWRYKTCVWFNNSKN